MTPPVQYDEWCAVLEALRDPEYDAEVYAAVAAGAYPATAGKVERTTRRLVDAYDARLAAVSKSLDTALRYVRTPFELERALSNMMTALVPLARLAACPVLPRTLKPHLRETLDSYAAKRKTSIEDSLRRQRPTNGALLSSVMRVSFAIDWTSLENPLPPQPSQFPAQASHDGDAGRGRRRILL